MQQATSSVVLWLCADALAAALTLISALILIRPWISPEVSTLINSFLSRLPQPLARAQGMFLGRALK
jgi:hypothetical protein